MVTTKVETYRDLIVWQKSHELSLELFKSKFSKKEFDTLATKIRDVCTMIPSNIAAGFNKRSKNAKLHYYRTALNSLEELEYLLVLANDLGMLKNYESLMETLDSISHMLKRLIRSNSPSS